MNFPNFHDGFFDGFRVAEKTAQLFLRTADQKLFTLVLQGVRALKLSGAREGNIILDLVIRDGDQMTLIDMQEVYGLAPDAPQADKSLKESREQGLQLLELNPSYGAEGLVLFETFEVTPGS